jgi:far upstream element-binding protein
MLLIQENQAMSVQPKPLRITGTAEKVEQAKRAVELLLSNDENNRMGGGGMGAGIMQQQRSMGEVIVPRSSVGIIIGKGGETIKRLASESGTKIQFKPDGTLSLLSLAFLKSPSISIQNIWVS